MHCWILIYILYLKYMHFMTYFHFTYYYCAIALKPETIFWTKIICKKFILNLYRKCLYTLFGILPYFEQGSSINCASDLCEIQNQTHVCAYILGKHVEQFSLSSSSCQWLIQLTVVRDTCVHSLLVLLATELCTWPRADQVIELIGCMIFM